MRRDGAQMGKALAAALVRADEGAGAVHLPLPLLARHQLGAD